MPSAVNQRGNQGDAFFHLLARRSALEYALPSSIAGAAKAGQQDFEISMASDIDAQHLAGDTAIEAFDHAVGLWRLGPRCAVNDLDPRAGAFEIVGGKAGSPEREGLSGSLKEGDSVGGILGVVDGEMDEP